MEITLPHSGKDTKVGVICSTLLTGWVALGKPLTLAKYQLPPKQNWEYNSRDAIESLWELLYIMHVNKLLKYTLHKVSFWNYNCLVRGVSYSDLCRTLGMRRSCRKSGSLFSCESIKEITRWALDVINRSTGDEISVRSGSCDGIKFLAGQFTVNAEMELEGVFWKK